MKIVRVSNYNNESEAEYVVAEGIKHETQAMAMCDGLNNSHMKSSYDFFKIVPDNYILWRGMEDLV